MRYVIFWVCVMCANPVFSFQNILTIKGNVEGIDGQKLHGANVLLISKSDSSIVHFTTTQSDGSFILSTKLPESQLSDLFLRVRFLGYQTVERPFEKNVIFYEFTLTESTIFLNGIAVKGAKPVMKISGDTTIYKVEDFANVQDRSIGDVLKKIPGVTVEHDGRISYNGKNVSRLYLEGDDLLGGKYNLGTRTIPQNMVDEIQILENHQNIKVLAGKVFSDDVDINLTFKDEARLKLVGQAELGAGIPKVYEGDINILALKKKYKAIQSIKSNNTGLELSENLLDFAKYQEMTKRGHVANSRQLSTGANTFAPISSDRYNFNNSSLVNSFNLWNLKNNYQLKSTGYYQSDKIKSNSINQNQYNIAGERITYSERFKNNLRPKNTFGEITLSANTVKSFLSNSIIYEHLTEKTDGIINTNSRSINQYYNYRSSTFSNEFDIIRTVKEKDLVRFYSYHTYQNNPEELKVDKSDINSLELLQQEINIPTYFTNNFIELIHFRGSLSQSYKLGFSLKNQELYSTLRSKALNTDSVGSISPNINDIEWLQTKVFIDSKYDWSLGPSKITLKLPVYFQKIAYSDSINENEKDIRFIFNPNLSLRFNLKKHFDGNIFYSKTNDPGNIIYLPQNPVLNNYRRFTQNEQLISVFKIERVGFKLAYKNPLDLLLVNVGLHFQKNRQNYITSTSLDKNNTIVNHLKVDNNFSSYNLHAGFSKYIFKLSSTFRVSYNFQVGQWNQYINSISIPSVSNNQNLVVKLSGNIVRKMHFESGLEYNWIASRDKFIDAYSNLNQTRLFEYDLSLIYAPTDKLYLKAVNIFGIRNSNKALQSKYNFLDITANIRVDKFKIDLVLDLTNLSNTKNFQILNATANSFSAQSFPLRPRMALFKAVKVF